MATIQTQVGPVTSADGGSITARSERTGGTVVQDAHGKYNEAVSRGNAYKLVVSGGAATAFTGGAGGTPLVSIYNPVGSGKNLSILLVGVASRVAASAAGTVGFNLWGGVSAANTGTLTTPTNMLTLQNAGSVALGSSNAVTTSTTAVGLVLPLASYYWATAAGAVIAPSFFDIAGAIVCAPGNFIALGGTAALTSATYDVAMIWEELPL